MIAHVSHLEDFGAKVVVPPTERYRVYQEQAEGLAKKKLGAFWAGVLESDFEVAKVRYLELVSLCKRLHKSRQAKFWIEIIHDEPWVASFKGMGR